MKMKTILLLVVSVVLYTSCDFGGKKAPAGLNEDSVNRILNQKDAEINNLLGTINDVQDGLRQITEAQGRINSLKSGGLEGSTANDIRENIAFIQRIVDQNRDRIADLQQQLQNSHINAQNLAQTIESLQKQVAEKDQQIAALTEELKAKDLKITTQANEISNLNTANAGLREDKANLTQANETKANTIQKQDKDLNSAWYVFGTKSELKQHNILRRGNVLTQDFNRNYFTQIDIRHVNAIPLESKRAKILTTHPTSSFVLERDANKMYTIRITDPATFWSVSKYLVVQVR